MEVAMGDSQGTRFQEEPAYVAGEKSTNYYSTADGHVFWFEQTSDGRLRMVYDGAAGVPFDGMTLQDDEPQLFWSPDGRRVTYIGRRGARAFVGVDGCEDPEFDDIGDSMPPTFSSDGEHLAYVAFVGGLPAVVLDRELASPTRLAPIAPVLSPDGRRLAYAEQDRENDPSARHRVVVDGDPGPWVKRVSEPLGLFSPDGRRFAHGILDDDHRTRIVVDGEVGRPLRGGHDLTFSPDGQRFVYVGEFDGGMALVEDGRQSPLFPLVAEPYFSPDSRRLAYGRILATNRKVVVLDGEIGPEFADVWAPVTFSPDSRRFAYLALHRAGGLLGGLRTKWTAVVDGQAGSEFDEVGSSATFSPDGRSVAFSARRGRSWSMVVNDEPGPAYSLVTPPRFSSAGRLGCVAQSGPRWTVVVDGIPGPWTDDIWTHGREWPFSFGPDGGSVAWVGRSADALHPIVNATVGPAYHNIGQPVFVDARTVLFWAARDQQTFRVTAYIG